MHINIIFTRLSTRWRPAVSTWHQLAGIGATFGRPHSSVVPLENKHGQPGYRSKAWSVDELEILQSALAEGQSPKAIARSWEGLLPGRTLRAIEIRCQRLHGPIRGFNTSEDNELLLKLVEEGLTIIEICARLPHRRRSLCQRRHQAL